MIFQNFSLFQQRSVLQNVMFPLEVRHEPKADREARARELLGLVGLADKASRYPSELSGGQQQRVAIARALALDPEVLLCDEATSALDPMTTQSILALLQKINQEMGITVVLITHEMAVIRQICNKVAILDGGKLAEEGSVDDVFMHTKSAAGRRLFGILPEQEELPPQSAIRIVFDGSTAGQPIISKLVKELGMDVNILSADVRQLNGKSFGQMMIARPEDPSDVKRVMEYLRAASMTVEEVHV
jgi:D-methionine transport system ATP-binding protein